MDDLTVPRSLDRGDAALIDATSSGNIGRDAYAASRNHKFGCGGPDAWRRLHGLCRGSPSRAIRCLASSPAPAAGLVLSAVHALLCLACGANQIGSGIAVWTLGLGLTSYFGRAFSVAK